MIESDCTWRLEIAIPSESQAGCEVIRQVLVRMESDSWNEADIFAVQMALEEGIMNAIKHGNKRDCHKRVHVDICLYRGKCTIKIRDEGCGFNLADVADPTLAENLEKCSGRGVMLIQQFMDLVQYQGCGNQVEMTKNRTS